MWLLALELVLTNPLEVIVALVRLRYVPAASFMSLLDMYIAHAGLPLLGIMLGGHGLHYAARRWGRCAESPWAWSSVLACAWVPHTFLLLVVTTLARVGWPETLVLLRGKYDLILPLLFAAVGVSAVWRQGKAKAKAEPGERGDRMVHRWIPWVATVVVATSAAVAAMDVAQRWPGSRPLVPGDPVPPFRVEGLRGGHVDRADLRGHVALIDFWATWCPPCVASLPELDTLQRDLRGEGLLVLAINVESGNLRVVERFVGEKGVRLPIYVDDGVVQRTFQVTSYPTSYLIDRRGEIREIYVGAPSPAGLYREVRALLDE